SSASASPAPPVFIAYTLCSLYLCITVEDTIEAFNSTWLLPPRQGELFDNPKACLHRLQGYVLSQGFAIVTTTSKRTRVQFPCIYYSIKTCNWCRLEEYIQKDTEGKILSNRKREDTAANTKDCSWEIYWSVKSVGK